MPTDLRYGLARELPDRTANPLSSAPSHGSSYSGSNLAASPPAPPPPKTSKVKTWNNQRSNHGAIAAAVVVTAVVAFLFSAVLFLCYHKAFGTGSGYDDKDGRPLLSLSFTDSLGSRKKQREFDLA